MIKTNEQGHIIYYGDTFHIILQRYSDPYRLNAARNAAIYLGKPDRENTRRPLSIIRQGHVPEIYRGEYAEFEFVDVDKVTYDHLITYTTRNMRVTGGNRALTSNDYTVPSDKIKDSQFVEANIQQSMKAYKNLIQQGETPQVSRSAMPVSAKLNPFVYQFNFVTLMQSLFTQRIWEKGSQGNTVKVVKGMWELVHHVDSELWDTVYEHFGTPAVEWKEVQRKLKKKQYTIKDISEDLNTALLNNDFTGDEPIEEWLRKSYGQLKSMW
jgi:hypothetical protein